MAQPMVIQKQMTWYLNNSTLFQLVLRITFPVEFSVKLNVHEALKDLQIAKSGISDGQRVKWVFLQENDRWKLFWGLEVSYQYSQCQSAIKLFRQNMQFLFLVNK